MFPINVYTRLPVFDDFYILKTKPGDEQALFNIILRNKQNFSLTMDWVKDTNSVFDIKKFIFSMMDAAVKNIEHNYVICKNYKIIGSISRQVFDKSRVDLGYWLDARFQGDGITSRCIKKYQMPY